MSTSPRSPENRERPPATDTLPRPGKAVTRPTTAGFGSSYYSDPRYEELFKEEETYSPNPEYVGAERDAANRFQNPFGPDFGPSQFRKTLIIVEQSQAGVRLFVQANPKAFLILLAIIILVLSMPGLGEGIHSLIKSLFGLH